ncbi:SLATT domain-containing protein, partial [Corallococcus exiguus]|nr:SLATT domain-containing protein [Corallococcus exiguus]
MRDKIWFTYKARIKAHERLERMDFHSQLLLVWYAILSSILAILSIRYPTILGDNTDILGAILSIGLLAISLSVTNRDFRGRAMLMRG